MSYASDHVFGFPVDDPIDTMHPYSAMRERERRARVEREKQPQREEVIEVQFEVQSNETDYTYTVYAVKGDNFLIYFNKEFSWQPMSLFRPKGYEVPVEKRTNSLFKSTPPSRKRLYP